MRIFWGKTIKLMSPVSSACIYVHVKMWSEHNHSQIWVNHENVFDGDTLIAHKIFDDTVKNICEEATNKDNLKYEVSKI